MSAASCTLSLHALLSRMSLGWQTGLSVCGRLKVSPGLPSLVQGSGQTTEAPRFPTPEPCLSRSHGPQVPTLFTTGPLCLSQPPRAETPTACSRSPPWLPPAWRTSSGSLAASLLTVESHPPSLTWLRWGPPSIPAGDGAALGPLRAVQECTEPSPPPRQKSPFYCQIT